MLPPPSQPLSAKDLQDFIYLNDVLSLLQRLHSCDANTETAGNRRFFADHCVALAAVTTGNDLEKQQWRQILEKGRPSGIDRGYAEDQLFPDILAGGSQFVGRFRNNAVWEVVAQWPIRAKVAPACIAWAARRPVYCSRAGVNRTAAACEALPPGSRHADDADDSAQA